MVGYCYDYSVVENSYYLAEIETEDGGKTSDQFKSGEVAYLLQAGIPEEDIYDDDWNYIETIVPYIWGQKIGTEDSPVFAGAKVYQVKNCKNEADYSNTDKNLDHKWENGTCNICSKICEHKWENNCEDTCDECDFTRVPYEHHYRFNCDTHCAECGELTQPNATHSSNSHPCCEGVCIYGCGTAIPATSEHDWYRYYSQEPTCAFNGAYHYRCNIYNRTYEEFPFATGKHNYENGICTGCGGMNPSIVNISIVGDITLKLEETGDNIFTGDIALDAGTYQFRVAHNNVLLGFNGTYTDTATIDYTVSNMESTIFNVTGGKYTFAYNASTKKLVIDYIPPHVLGDANWDGNIDIRDVIFVMKHIVGTITLDEKQSFYADMDSDGIISVMDVLYLQKNDFRYSVIIILKTE